MKNMSLQSHSLEFEARFKPIANPNQYSVVIVDAFASGSLLAPYFHSLGLRCIHVQSRPDIIMGASTFQKSHFIADFLYKDNLGELVTRLEKYNPILVMPGFQTSVELAELLGNRLQVPSNNAKTTVFRNNKYFMHQRLAESGLNHAKSFLVDNKEDLLKHYFKHFLEKPVVVKPQNSGGTDQVFYCKNETELSAAFAAIFNTINVMGRLNDKILLQEYLQGQEYIVNTLSWQGKHITTDIWRSDKISENGNHFVYEKTVLLEYEGEIQRELREYNNRVLDALEFSFGPSHNELIFTKNGPVLVEMNPRISGGHLPEISLECIDTGGQVRWMKRLTERLLMSNWNLTETPYNIKKMGYTVALLSKVSGKITNFKNLKRIYTLPSFYTMDMWVNIGDKVEKTVDVWTIPGLVILIHEDHRVVLDDYQKLRDFEVEGLYELES